LRSKTLESKSGKELLRNRRLPGQNIAAFVCLEPRSFREPLGDFSKSCRGENSSVSSVCQARTTTSSILDANRYQHCPDSRLWLWRTPQSHTSREYERCVKRPTGKGYAPPPEQTRRRNGAKPVDTCGNRGGLAVQAYALRANFSITRGAGKDHAPAASPGTRTRYWL
jgi:hypothetical protein